MRRFLSDQFSLIKTDSSRFTGFCCWCVFLQKAVCMCLGLLSATPETTGIRLHFLMKNVLGDQSMGLLQKFCRSLMCSMMVDTSSF